MLNETYRAMLGNKSVIRETFMYGKQRAAEIGYENVFDYSLGNPSVPCPQDAPDVPGWGSAARSRMWPPCRIC